MSTEIERWRPEVGWYAGPWSDEVYYYDDQGRWHTSMTKLEDTSHIAKRRLVPESVPPTPIVQNGVATGFPLVAGTCAACGGRSLFLGAGGHVTCARLDCPNPTNVDDLLNDWPYVAPA